METKVTACNKLFHSVAVLQHWINSVDEAVQSFMAMKTIRQSYCAMVILHGIVPTHLCIWPFSILSFHTHITVVVAYPYELKYGIQTCFPGTNHSPCLNSPTCWYCAIPCWHGIPAFNFMFPPHLKALHWLSKPLQWPYWLHKRCQLLWYITDDTLIVDSLVPFFLGVALSKNSSVNK